MIIEGDQDGKGLGSGMGRVRGLTHGHEDEWKSATYWGKKMASPGRNRSPWVGEVPKINGGDSQHWRYGACRGCCMAETLVE